MSDDQDTTEDTAEKDPIGALLESKMALMVVGFILTTVLGGLLNSWIQGEQWKRESQFQMFQNQLDEGDTVQNEVLNAFGTMRRHLNTARINAKDAYFLYKNAPKADESIPPQDRTPLAAVEEAKQYFKQVLNPAYQELTYAIHRTRNKVGLVFGKNAAGALLNRNDNALHYDICSVLTRTGDKGVNEDCETRRKAEASALLKGKGFHQTESMFHAVRVSRFLIKRMIWCMDPRETFGNKQTKCEDMALLQSLMDRRYNQTGTAFDHLSDTIFDQMVKMHAAVR